MWTAKLIFLWLFAAAAAYSDLRYRRVPNPLIAVAAAGGFVLAAAGGRDSLCTGLSGMALGFLLLFPAFLLHMVGGGDVKSLSVIGLVAGTLGCNAFSYRRQQRRHYAVKTDMTRVVDDIDWMLGIHQPSITYDHRME